MPQLRIQPIREGGQLYIGHAEKHCPLFSDNNLHRFSLKVLERMVKEHIGDGVVNNQQARIWIKWLASSKNK